MIKRHFLFIFLAACVICAPCQAILVADIEVVKDQPRIVQRANIILSSGENDPSSNRRAHADAVLLTKYVRLFFFDTDTQKLVNSDGTQPGSVIYCAIPDLLETTGFISHFIVTNWCTITYAKDQQFEVDVSSFNINSVSSRVLRTSLPVKNVSKLFNVNLQYDPKWLRSVIGLIKPQDQFPKQDVRIEDVQGLFNKTSSRRRNGELSWFHYFYDPADYVLKRTLQGEFNSRDAGEIGELISDISMHWLGFTKIEGKYQGNNGFDGIFRGKDYLFFTESKFHQATKCLSTLLEKDLYPSVNTRLGKLEAKDTKMVDFIRSFLGKQPLENIFLLASDVIVDGQVKSLVKRITEVHKSLDPLKAFISQSEEAQTSDEENIAERFTTVLAFILKFYPNLADFLEEVNRQKEQAKEEPPVEVLHQFKTLVGAHEVELTEEVVLGNGDCGYSAMNITRQQAADLLVANLNQENIRTMIGQEVEDMFFQLPIQMKGNLLYKSIVSQEADFDRDEQQVVSIANERLELPAGKHLSRAELLALLNKLNLSGELANIAQQLVDLGERESQLKAQKVSYCTQEATCRDYIQYFIRPAPQQYRQLHPDDNNWLNYSRHLMADGAYRSACINALTLIMQKNLIIFNEEHQLMHKFIHLPEGTQNTVFLLHIGNNHFNKLVPINNAHEDVGATEEVAQPTQSPRLEWPAYSLQSLKVLVTTLYMQHNVSQAAIARYARCSATPIQKLRGVRSGGLAFPSAIWTNLTGSMDELCKVYCLNTSTLIKAVS